MLSINTPVTCAWLQVYVLAGLLARFKFRQVQLGAKVDYVFSLSLPMKQGLVVAVQERQSLRQSR
jgi:hypothetical protein